MTSKLLKEGRIRLNESNRWLIRCSLNTLLVKLLPNSQKCLHGNKGTTTQQTTTNKLHNVWYTYATWFANNKQIKKIRKLNLKTKYTAVCWSATTCNHYQNHPLPQPAEWHLLQRQLAGPIGLQALLQPQSHDVRLLRAWAELLMVGTYISAPVHQTHLGQYMKVALYNDRPSCNNHEANE